MPKDGCVVVEPLRSSKLSGEPYVRPAEIQSRLVELWSLPRDELIRNARVRSVADERYVPSECLMHFVRACRADNNDVSFEGLYAALYDRVLRHLRSPESRDGQTTSLTDEAIREDVAGRFAELLAADRTVYSEKLDYFEIRFDHALAGLRATARKKAWLHARRTTPLEFDDESGELSPMVESAAADFMSRETSLLDDPDYRLRFDAAIDGLPPLQGRIIDMLRKGFLVGSTDPGRLTIAKVLDKDEKTIRKHRDLAFASLRTRLCEGGEL